MPNTDAAASLALREVASDDPRFLRLLTDLDAALAVVNGDEHDFYMQFCEAPTLDYVLLAEVDGEVVGCGALRHKDAATTEIKRMYVREERRGHGYAAQLLAALEDHARRAGFAEAVLETAHDLHAANRLYERMGYRRIDCFEPYVGKALSVCWGKALR